MIQTNVQFQNQNQYQYQLYSAEENIQFGVFTVNCLGIKHENQSKNSIVLHSTNDMSGSMSDACKDGRTKMQHLKLTLTNITSLLANNHAESEAENREAEVLMEIAGFDDKIEPVLDRTLIEPKSIENIHGRIATRLNPRGMTNIELAFKHATKQLSMDENVDAEKHFVFMTDGNITKGSSDISELKTHLPENCQKYFIGFGADHDYELLQGLCSNEKSQYYYVDAIENAGFVFGEIVHTILHPALKSGNITIDHGEIYDANDGQWKTELDLPILCEDALKHYHIRSSTPYEVEIRLTGQNPVGDICIEDFGMPPLQYLTEDYAADTFMNARLQIPDITQYMFRQRTLELMFEAQQYKKTNKSLQTKPLLDKKMNELQGLIKTYCESNAAILSETDTYFLKQLQDDLYICSKKLKSRRGLLFINIRLYTQAREGSYNITDLDENDGYERRMFGRNVNSFDIDDEDDDGYNIERSTINRAYTTPRQLTIMRACSQTPYLSEEDDDDDNQVQRQPLTQTVLDLDLDFDDDDDTLTPRII